MNTHPNTTEGSLAGEEAVMTPPVRGAPGHDDGSLEAAEEESGFGRQGAAERSRATGFAQDGDGRHGDSFLRSERTSKGFGDDSQRPGQVIINAGGDNLTAEERVQWVQRFDMHAFETRVRELV